MDKRIYCVVAETVQHPLDYSVKSFPLAAPTTRTIVQPPGRLAAQVAHVVSLTRLNMVIDRFKTDYMATPGAVDVDVVLSFLQRQTPPYTTIVLVARDSYELYHVEHLLNGKLNYHTFYDTDQPDYGSKNSIVSTALATEPTTKEEVEGILDYLPLWSPKCDPGK